jgi:3-hydroxyisobutyrate dehydrogenase
VLVCLPTSNEVRAVLFGENGVAGAHQPGAVVADMTTGDPNATKAIASELKSSGYSMELIDAPVSGGPHGAEAGTIAIMVGASDEQFARIKPTLEAISPNIFHCGRVGAGHTMKLVNNMVAAGVRAVTFEAVTMGVKNGLTLQKCAEVLDKSSGHSYTTQFTLPRMASGFAAANFQTG